MSLQLRYSKYLFNQRLVKGFLSLFFPSLLFLKLDISIVKPIKEREETRVDNPIISPFDSHSRQYDNKMGGGNDKNLSAHRFTIVSIH